MTHNAILPFGTIPNHLAPQNHQYGSWGALASPESLKDNTPRNALLSVLDPEPSPRPHYLEEYSRANFDHELQKPYWTPQEAVAVLMSCDPIYLPTELIIQNQFLDALAREAVRLHRLVKRAQEIGDLNEIFRPQTFINWALRQYIEVPKNLVKLAYSRGMKLERFGQMIDRLKAIHADEVAAQAKEICQLKTQIAKIESSIRKHQQEKASLATSLEASKATVNKLTLVVDSYRVKEENDANHSEHKTAQEEPAQSPTISAITRKYNTVAKLLYGLARHHYSVDMSSATPLKSIKIIDDLLQQGIAVDDETLKGHLREGSEQAAR